MTAFSPESEAILVHLLLQLCVILFASRFVGWLARGLGQAQAMGEILAGLLLGPTLLGWVAPGPFEALFRAPGPPILAFLSHIGLILALFLIGMEFDFAEVPKYGRQVVGAAVASLVASLVAGFALAAPLWAVLPGPGSFVAYQLFLGLMMGITAIPIMGRVLMDMGLIRTRLGVLAITTGASKDLVTWLLMLVAVGLAKEGVNLSRLGVTVGAVLLLGGLTLTVGPRVMAWVLDRTGRPVDGRLGGTSVAALLGFCFTMAAITSEIGVFAIFGAFLAGVLVSFDRVVATALSRGLHDLTLYLFLPIFFTSTGLRTDLTDLGPEVVWGPVVFVVGTLASGGVSTLFAWRSGFSKHEALAFGALINTPGLMVLILLNVALDAGVISAKMFGLMMAVAMARNLLVTPVLRWARDRGLPEVSASRADAPPALP